MASVVSICNLALSNVGKSNITDLTEKSAEARACNQFYAHTRDVLLQSYPWTAARRTQFLAEVDNDKPGAWRYAYTLPSDCLQVRWIRPVYAGDGDTLKEYSQDRDTTGQELRHPYEIEGQTLYGNLSPCVLRYTARLTDPTKYSPLFIEALSWHLAVRLAMPLTRDPKIRADALKVATSAQASAEQADASETRHTSDIVTDFIAVRDHG
ncbi:hypothetical protein [Rhizobium sp. RM]|uniref:hypothetical protein n=1 Tax=Rhizobium sp. RM TaxID=2748079 RepID=UPI00110D88E1|nr:hypothetical protein [Rhizobium sp. RM]NWJ26125.1 hypothetical protein [Rhizobium sp. RM]TMV20720.1 hypothetical protein BJG94_08470 [Rhizobium sp. Td3]